MGLLDKIKNEAKKSGQNKSKIAYFKEGVKVRIRFLTDMDEGLEVTFHDSFDRGINVPCQEQLGRTCAYCEDEELRTRSLYVWPIYNYDAKEVQLFMFAVNNCSPVPSLVAMFENYGTLTDRDYVITRSGKQQNTSYAVIPMDKAKFRNEKAKPYSTKTILSMIDKAFPADDDDDDEDEKPAKRASSSKSKTQTKKSKKPVDDYDEDDDDYDDEEMDDEDDVEDYSEMSAKELFQLCKKRKIDVVPKKPEKFYIRLLEENDKAQDDWEDEEDEWEDE